MTEGKNAEPLKGVRQKTLTVKDGELMVAREGETLETIVGHGVCVCILSEVSKTGGMCHYLLPAAPEGELPDTRFGDTALFQLVRRMLSEAPGEKYVAAIAGGALIDGQHEAADQNIRLAHEYLEMHEIPIMLNEERGLRHRRVVFQTSVGGIKIMTM